MQKNAENFLETYPEKLIKTKIDLLLIKSITRTELLNLQNSIFEKMEEITENGERYVETWTTEGRAN